MDGSIYAYHTPKSADQHAFIQARLAQMKRERKNSQDLTVTDQPPGTSLIKTHSNTTTHSTSADSAKHWIQEHSLHWHPLQSFHTSHRRHTSQDSAIRPPPPPSTTSTMHPTSSTTSLSPPSTQPTSSTTTLNTTTHHQSPFETLSNARRYLRHQPYPLPIDLPELHRQNLHTLLATKAFGAPLLSLQPHDSSPTRVLDLGCGTGYWSALCDSWLRARGAKRVSFTGVDLPCVGAVATAELGRQGVDWRFVGVDLRGVGPAAPLPFADGAFDCVMVKDVSWAVPLGAPFRKLLEECARVLGPGGRLEVWDTDHVIRALLPHGMPRVDEEGGLVTREALDVAEMVGAVVLTPDTPFGVTRDRGLAQANKWIMEALDRRKLSVTPCGRMAELMLAEPNDFEDLGIRRVAIPLGDLKWEYGDGDGADRWAHCVKAPWEEDRVAFRQTALTVVLQLIDSLEPLLKETSQKSTEEWNYWWATLMARLIDPKTNALDGECLELGAWWMTKSLDDDK